MHVRMRWVDVKNRKDEAIKEQSAPTLRKNSRISFMNCIVSW